MPISGGEMHKLGYHISIPVGSARGNGRIRDSGDISKTLKVWQAVKLREAGADGFFSGFVGWVLVGEVAELG